MDIGGVLSSDQKAVVETIVQELRNGTRRVNKASETKEVLHASSVNGKPQKDGRIADFYMRRGGKEYYFEIKTVKPNIDVFTTSKTKLLEWIARKRKMVETILAFPYNPYYPRPYERFTMQGLVEVRRELLIGEEYWDFLGGDGTFGELLKVFDEVGRWFKKDIAEKIRKVAAEKMGY